VNLSASDIYLLYRPSKCDRRVYLRSHDEPEGESSDFEKLIEELGKRHEADHLATFRNVADLSGGSLSVRAGKTLDAVEAGQEVIYQGVLLSQLPGSDDAIIGIPDFLIKDGDSYKVSDCKLSRHVGEGRHEEIVLQLELYGWLFEQNFHKPPAILEVYLGDQTIARLSYNGGKDALAALHKIQSLSQQNDEPYSPVGWSKCGSCTFRTRCWKLAEEMDDVALVYELDQGTARALKQKGTTTIDDLLKKFTIETLSDLRKPYGEKMVRVGVGAERILQQAEALKSGKEKLLSPLRLPIAENMVMFDLEGLPPQFDELDKVYLWGMQVYGKRPGKFMPALAGFGKEGDREGWNQFLNYADTIFKEYGDLPFIHWHHYETTKIKSYINRYGDGKGIAERVLMNCVDLLKITRDSLVLPEYSYSLKVIEKRAGFKRTMKEFGGDWSIVQYIRAIETEDDNLRNKIMSDILKYNEEDLKATWAVLQWLQRKG
jgi:predicted RecB family nuclease